MSGPAAPAKDASAADFICKLKFRNTLPEIPFDPKLRNYPFDPLRFVRYKPTSLEKSFKYPLLSEPDLGIPLDLIDPETFKISANRPPLAPEDAALIKKDNFAVGKSSAHRPVVPFLRKMEYMTDFTRDQRQREREQAAARASSRVQRDEDDVRQRERIERGFEAAKETPVHRTKPHLTATSVQLLVPDLELIQNNYTHVIFETTPVPDPPHPSDPQFKQKESHQDFLVSRSVLKAYTSNNEEKVVVFMVPQKSAEEVHQMSVFGEMDEGNEEAVPYDWVRKYRYDFTAMTSEFVLLHDRERVRYIPLPLKAYLSKAPVGSAIVKPSQITVKKRPLNEEEITGRKEKLQRFESEPAEAES